MTAQEAKEKAALRNLKGTDVWDKIRRKINEGYFTTEFKKEELDEIDESCVYALIVLGYQIEWRHTNEMLLVHSVGSYEVLKGKVCFYDYINTEDYDRKYVKQQYLNALKNNETHSK